MADRTHVDVLLRDLSGGSLRLDDDGQCVLQDPDGIVFRIEVPVGSDFVYWIAPLGPYREPLDNMIAQHMLKAGHLALETRGAHLSIDPRAQEFVLWASAPLADLAAATFEKVTLNFSDLATIWSRQVAEWQRAEPAAHREDSESIGDDMMTFRI